MPRTTVYAVRDAESGLRLSNRYRTRRELVEHCPLSRFDHTGLVVEVYRTTQDLPRHTKKRT